MIRLTNTTTDLLRVTPSSSNTVKAVVGYSDKTSTAYTGGNQVTTISAASITTICGTPAASTIRDIDHITFYCASLNTLTVGLTVSATEYILIVASLSAGDMLEYTHAAGWRVLDSSGLQKMTMPGYLPLTGGTISGALTLSSALTYGGVTLSNAVTGTGNMVLSASPTLTGTLTAAAITASGAVATGPLTVTGRTIVNEYVFSATSVDMSSPSATQFTAYANTTNGAVITGYGTTYDTSLTNRSGTVVLGVTANTTGIVIPGTLASGALTVTGAISSTSIISSTSALSISGSHGVATGLGIASGHASVPIIFYSGQFGVDAVEVARTSSTGLSVTGTLSATSYYAGVEETEPAAPAANGYRIFAVDSGGGKTILKVRFASGASQTIATEP